MINIASTQPVHWPTAPLPSVPAVSAVVPVQRVQSDGQAGMGPGREPRSGTMPEKRGITERPEDAAQAAPLLPRDAEQSDPSTQAVKGSEQARDITREAKEAEDAGIEKAKQLLEVLSTVWKASAAVVEGALGRNSLTAAQGEEAGAKAAALLPSQSERADVQDMGQAHLARNAGEPVAYTEQGSGAWKPVEPGQLVNQKV